MSTYTANAAIKHLLDFYISDSKRHADSNPVAPADESEILSDNAEFDVENPTEQSERVENNTITLPNSWYVRFTKRTIRRSFKRKSDLTTTLSICHSYGKIYGVNNKALYIDLKNTSIQYNLNDDQLIHDKTVTAQTYQLAQAIQNDVEINPLLLRSYEYFAPLSNNSSPLSNAQLRAMLAQGFQSNSLKKKAMKPAVKTPAQTNFFKPNLPHTAKKSSYTEVINQLSFFKKTLPTDTQPKPIPVPIPPHPENTDHEKPGDNAAAADTMAAQAGESTSHAGSRYPDYTSYVMNLLQPSAPPLEEADNAASSDNFAGAKRPALSH